MLLLLKHGGKWSTKWMNHSLWTALCMGTMSTRWHPLTIIMNIVKSGYYGRAATISLCSSSSEVSIQEWLLNRVRRLFKQTHFMVMNRHYIKPKNDKNWGFHDQDGQSCSFNAITICCCLLRMLSKKGTKEFIYDKI